MSENVGLTLSLACLENGLTPGGGAGGGHAGGAPGRCGSPTRAGSRAGCAADLVLWGARSPAHLCWHVGVNHALAAW